MVAGKKIHLGRNANPIKCDLILEKLARSFEFLFSYFGKRNFGLEGPNMAQQENM